MGPAEWARAPMIRVLCPPLHLSVQKTKEAGLDRALGRGIDF